MTLASTKADVIHEDTHPQMLRRSGRVPAIRRNRERAVPERYKRPFIAHLITASMLHYA